MAVLDRAAGPAQEVADALISSGAQALAVTCDITERPSVDAAVDQVVSELGPIDVLVNNAGWDLFVPFLDTTPEDWSKLIDINLVGALNMHHAVLPRHGRARSRSCREHLLGCGPGRFVG